MGLDHLYFNSSLNTDKNDISVTYQDYTPDFINEIKKYKTYNNSYNILIIKQTANHM